jgi:tetratricopeptide (TPR) repeat protein
VLLERKGRWGAAIQYYNRAIALQWNFVSPWIAKARVLLDHGRAPEALECFEKVTSFEATNVEAWTGMARAHSALGNAEAAAAALDHASTLDSESPIVHRGREATSPEPIEEPERREAPEELETREAPKDFSSLLKAFEEIEEEPEATGPPKDAPSVPSDFQTFVESIESDEEDVQVLLQLAELALEGGDPSMALKRYEEVLERADRNSDAWTGRGVALQQVGRYREAIEAYDRALSLKPDHALALKWRATCARHLESGRSE